MRTNDFGSPRILQLTMVPEPRGSLIAAEFSEQIPFEVKRLFSVFDAPTGLKRGQHAHRECHQLLMCLSGSVEALADDGNTQTIHRLIPNGEALYMPPLTWGTQSQNESGTVLLVLASHHYDAADYIHTYEEFQGLVNLAN